MRDGEMVTAIVAGEPGGLAAAYDRYAAPLHAYCRTLLTEPADAANAVQDTFVIAAAKLSGLRDPDRLRPWLYAVARNECHRRLRTQANITSLDEAADATDQFAAIDVDPERAGLRELVSAAMAGLNPGEREIIELNLRQELHGSDLAVVLGVPRNQAHALASRARGQFETALGTLLVARSGRASCAKLDELLADWDGQLTVLLRKRLSRHIEHCDQCGQRKRRELHPAMLLSLLPAAVLPDGLRAEVLRLVASTEPDDTAGREAVATRAEPFEPGTGFPVAIDPPPPVTADRRRGYAVAAVAAAAVLCGLLIEAAAHPGHGTPGSSPVALGSSTLEPQPQGSGTSATGGGSARPKHTGARSSASTSVSPGATTSTSPTPTLSVSSSPSPSVRSTHSPSPPPPTSALGSLSASPGAVGLGPSPLGGPPSGSFTLTANGAQISFSIVVPAGDEPDLVVSPTSGTLAAGASVTISVTWNSTSPLSTSVSVDPGGLAVGIDYSNSGVPS
ncbi:MAG TPA: sigma-70 family RNA polymerase sigma factor [Trebonia sp.]|jgi:RNA polymerase sigma factor (sigma-70 family)